MARPAKTANGVKSNNCGKASPKIIPAGRTGNVDQIRMAKGHESSRDSRVVNTAHKQNEEGAILDDGAA